MATVTAPMAESVLAWMRAFALAFMVAVAVEALTPNRETAVLPLVEPLPTTAFAPEVLSLLKLDSTVISPLVQLTEGAVVSEPMCAICSAVTSAVTTLAAIFTPLAEIFDAAMAAFASAMPFARIPM